VEKHDRDIAGPCFPVAHERVEYSDGGHDADPSSRRSALTWLDTRVMPV
jgi:hypothetical protein